MPFTLEKAAMCKIFFGGDRVSAYAGTARVLEYAGIPQDPPKLVAREIAAKVCSRTHTAREATRIRNWVNNNRDFILKKILSEHKIEGQVEQKKKDVSARLRKFNDGMAKRDDVYRERPLRDNVRDHTRIVGVDTGLRWYFVLCE